MPGCLCADPFECWLPLCYEELSVPDKKRVRTLLEYRRILGLRRPGMSPGDIAVAAGVSVRTVHRAMTRMYELARQHDPAA